MGKDDDTGACAYAELGLAPGASEAEVKVAWRRLASQWHPDRNPSAAAIDRMKRINQAIERIRAGRSDMPRPSEAGTRAAPAADAAADRATTGSATTDAGTSDRAAHAYRTISRKVKLTLEEAAAGCVKVVRGRVVDVCGACTGAGMHKLGTACAACQGDGTVQRGWYGWFGARTQTCEACHGDGIARQACLQCAGKGRLPPRAYQVNVRIPHGVRDGDVLHVGARQQPLDLRVEVLPHPLFTLDRDGTLHCEVPVDGFAWIAQRTIEVPTLFGLRRLPLSRDHLSYRLEGLGFPVTRQGVRGVQLVRLKPVFAPRLTSDQEILLDQLMAAAAPADCPAVARLSEWRRTLRTWERKFTRPADADEASDASSASSSASPE